MRLPARKLVMFASLRRKARPHVQKVHDLIGRRLGRPNVEAFYTDIIDFYAKGVDYRSNFVFADFSTSVLDFVESQRVSGTEEYRYAPSVEVPTLYSSIYAVLTLSLFGEFESSSSAERARWKTHIDQFQSHGDGLFRDSAVENKIFEDTDWWGARHLTLHALAAYACLKTGPTYDFGYLERYYGEDGISKWFESLNWSMEGDADNQIMNIASMLAVSRDNFDNDCSRRTLERLKNELLARVCPETGLWCEASLECSHTLSRAIQFAYHLYPILLYDGHEFPYPNGLVDCVLRNQNRLGGFAPHLNSSACEDIDSVFLLMKLAQQTSHRREEVIVALQRYAYWVFANMNADGGFVFRRCRGFEYGHEAMTSAANESHMFATWFRSLSVAFAMSLVDPSADFHFSKCPGFAIV